MKGWVSDDLDASRRFGTISTVSFAVGGAGLLVGVVALLTARSDERAVATPVVGIAPWVGLGAAGICSAF